MSAGTASFRGNRFRGRGNYPRKQNWHNSKSHDRVPHHPPVAEASISGTDITDVGSQKIQTKRIDLSSSGPYVGWRLYFEDERYTKNSSPVRKIKAMEAFIARNSHSFPFLDIEERKTCYLDINSLYIDKEFNSEWKNFNDDLLNNPENTIKCLELAIHQSIFMFMQNEAKPNLQEGETVPFFHVPVIRARFYNYEPLTFLKNIKTSYYGKLVSIRGTIVRVGNAKLLCKWMAFYCSSCKEIQCVKQPEGVYSRPSRCITDGCHSRSFTPVHSSPFTYTVSYQTIRLQEVADEGGGVPRTIECELTEDLTESCIPGEVVIVTGIVKVRNSYDTSKKVLNSYLLYIDAISVSNDKTGSPLTCNKQVELNSNDYYIIEEIQSQTNLFKLLVNSLCPKIYGHEMVKAGLLLALFGGSRYLPSTRPDPHVLLVGDPGLGKSQMLQACVNVSHRGLFVSGNTSTRSGLTVTLARDSNGSYSLEAGALVLADSGCCAIDEFDKMSSQHQALLEAMEQQSISIAKGGILCSLPARTSILAAANPVGGHYNPAKTVSENLSMGSPILSRFDLVFILLDQPNEQLDCLLTKHIMAQHSEMKGDTSQENTSGSISNLMSKVEKRPLWERLKIQHEETIDVLPHELLRKFLIYAREYVKPVLTPEACNALQAFYLQIRQYHHKTDSTPITTRQLESLIRLTQARAKLELREQATVADAEDVIEIMKHTMVDTLSDGLNGLMSEPMRKISGSSRNQTKKFLAALQRQAKMQNRSMFSLQELKEVAAQAQVQTSDFQSFISTLNEQGFLLKKASKLYQLLSDQ